jgi:hypothetical protein
MKTEIESILPSGYGHWKVKCSRFNLSKKYPYKIVSITKWEATTNDSMLIDEYKDGIKRARTQLIRLVKRNGLKKIEHL